MMSLSDLIQIYGETVIRDIIQGYVSAHEKENPEVSAYLRENAIPMEKRDLSRTYLSVTEDLEILGFVTLGIKCMTIPEDSLLSSSVQRQMNIEHETRVAQAFLLGQLSRSEASAPGLGKEFMAFAVEMLGEAKKIVGCRMVRLDCKDDLVGYYEGLGFRLVGKNKNKGLNQMVKLIRRGENRGSAPLLRSSGGRRLPTSGSRFALLLGRIHLVVVHAVHLGHDLRGELPEPP